MNSGFGAERQSHGLCCGGKQHAAGGCSVARPSIPPTLFDNPRPVAERDPGTGPTLNGRPVRRQGHQIVPDSGNPSTRF